MINTKKMSLSHDGSAVDNSAIFYGGRIMALTPHAECLLIGADQALQQAMQAFWKEDQGVSTGGDMSGAHLRTWLRAHHPQLVPQLNLGQRVQPNWQPLLASVKEACEHGRKPALIGPLTLLWLGEVQGREIDRLELLEQLLPAYGEIFGRLAARGVEWVQVDEPILALDLPLAWTNAFERAYHILQYSPLKKLVATYNGDLRCNLGVAALLPVAGLHLDSVSVPEQLASVFDRLPTYKVLSLGECARHEGWGHESLQEARARFGENLMVADQAAA
ncbi:5-methyltetrahydropteroyltriglutamate-- homocysteine S-methyltransferase [Pseudomonas cannabina]|uniref:5-methyltetrahydropteroyltriglutamate--homocysteine S-methyltransferase n=2 Tax=Pseudomonas cannabina TaxID=86840 RepID=A0A0P9Q4G8_PSECA|nr:5-methyltetrahydropteroyltriglutamate-- homocysteine S-methyltransferase [Pseudomonas cannabina]RMN23060.1 5-methyltetrahydropteroyltriglutamate-- homocysteine S-methyltransferase [Pseudomonas cannabina]